MRQLCIVLSFLAAMMTLQAQQDGDLVHTVDAGDTLISIASAYGVTLDQLLSLNGLDLDAILPIGRRLIVIPDAGQPEDAEEPDDSVKAEGGSVDTVSVEGLPPAPVAEADAPMMDPADISPQLCVAMFADDNQNGMRDPGEAFLKDGTVLLLDGDGAEQLRYGADGESEPHCLRDLSPQVFQIEGVAPAGYGLTNSASLRLDLRDGGIVRVEFGAKRGLVTSVHSAPDPPAKDETQPGDGEAAILRELSGLFVLALAGVVLFSGMIVSLFLRIR